MMDEWRPIETAPRETPVIIFASDSPIAGGKIMICCAILKNIGSSFFWSCWGASGWECENDFYNPTHWMPLPESPK